MPTYVYKCDKCGYHFEKLQKFSDKPVKVCPRCSGHVKRLIHATGVVFKGSGWYITDSRGSSSASIESGSSTSKSAEASKPSESSKSSESSQSSNSD